MFDMGRIGSGDIEIKPTELVAKEKMNDGDAANHASQSGLTDNDFDTIGLFVDRKLKSYLKENQTQLVTISERRKTDVQSGQ